MATPQSPKVVQKRLHSRKSIAHPPTTDSFVEMENVTIDLSATAAPGKAKVKKSRSKSLGPGGLEALTEDAGNRRKVRLIKCRKS